MIYIFTFYTKILLNNPHLNVRHIMGISLFIDGKSIDRKNNVESPLQRQCTSCNDIQLEL